MVVTACTIIQGVLGISLIQYNLSTDIAVQQIGDHNQVKILTPTYHTQGTICDLEQLEGGEHGEPIVGISVLDRKSVV